MSGGNLYILYLYDRFSSASVSSQHYYVLQDGYIAALVYGRCLPMRRIISYINLIVYVSTHDTMLQNALAF